MLDKIGSFFEKVWTWIVVSSADPTKTSLTVKGAAGATVATFIGVLGAVHYQVPGLPDVLNGIVDQIVLVTQYGLGIVSAGSILVGSVRKVLYLFHNPTA